MAKAEAAHLSALGFEVPLDEPYQHYQFSGRADLVAVDRARRALLHLESRTRFPDIQAALYDPSPGDCLRLPRAPNRPGFGFPSREGGGVVVWTGRELIFWSGGTGADLVGPPPADGVAFRPAPETP